MRLSASDCDGQLESPLLTSIDLPDCAYLCLIALQGSLVMYDWWLGRWSGLPPDEQDDLGTNLGGLGVLAAFTALAVGAQAALWGLCSLEVSSSLHADGFRHVLRAPLEYLLSTERGRCEPLITH